MNHSLVSARAAAHSGAAQGLYVQAVLAQQQSGLRQALQGCTTKLETACRPAALPGQSVTLPKATFAACRDIPMLEAVILESLRLQPPAYLVGRCAATSQQMGPFCISTGVLPHSAFAPACQWC